MNTPNLMASGNIPVSSFVKISGQKKVAVAGANEAVIGISFQAGRYPPIPQQSGTNYAAISGDPVPVYGVGDQCHLLIGSGGVTAGDRIKSGASGEGIKVATTGTTQQEVGAIALETAVEGELCLVQVVKYSFYPALA